MLSGVVFDFDGVLVDSERAHFEGLRRALAKKGVVITFPEYTDHYLAYDDRGGVRRALERHKGDASPDLVEEVVAAKKATFAALLPAIPFLPGAKDLVVALHEAAVPLAIASGARREEIETLLGAQGLRQRFRG